MQIKRSSCSLKENLVTFSIWVEGKHPFTVIIFILSEFTEYRLRENRLTTTKNEREALAYFDFSYYFWELKTHKWRSNFGGKNKWIKVKLKSAAGKRGGMFFSLWSFGDYRTLSMWYNGVAIGGFLGHCLSHSHFSIFFFHLWKTFGK